MTVKPYLDQEGTKKEQVTTMFNRIAPKYDFLNRVLSFGIDKIWRRRVVRLVRSKGAVRILDVATGTGDLAIALSKIKESLITGVDISQGMLSVAQTKVEALKLNHRIDLHEGDSEQLPFENDSFDAVTVAFGVRNFGDLQKGLGEMTRVLKPGGHLVVLEFSTPVAFPFKQIYLFYFKHLLPRWGGFVSRDSEAYSYLPASVMAFPEGEAFDKELRAVNLAPLKRYRQTFGIATIYVAQKREQ